MKRRKFFYLTGSGAAGLALGASCGGKEKSQSGETADESIKEIPDYRNNIKTNLT